MHKIIFRTNLNYLLNRSLQNDFDLIFCISLNNHVDVLWFAHIGVAKSKTPHIAQLYLRITWNGFGKLFYLCSTEYKFGTDNTTQSSLFSLITYISVPSS